VAYPPLTPFFGRLSLELFGTSLAGFRFFAALAEAVAVVLAGLIAHELGGRRGAQLVAAAAAAPFFLLGGAMMQYVSFDYLAWVLTAYFAVRLLKSEDPRWWIAIGCSIGLGMMAKYSIPFFVAGLAVGLVLTDARRYLKSKWLWYGAAVALAIFLPNFIWQARHGFISLDFLRYIHARDIRIGRTQGFLPDQLKLTLFGFPLVIAGLHFFLFSQAGRSFRVLGWMYVTPLLLFVVAKGRGYYLAPAYPMLYAAGAVWGEQWLGTLGRRSARVAVAALARTALAADVVMVALISLPISPAGSARFQKVSKINGDLREEIGWPELVRTVAGIRDGLAASERGHLGVLAGNYGEAGAIDLYGPAYSLPGAISGTNSFWARGYGDPPPQTLIVLGLSREFLDRNFQSCELAGHISNPFGVKNEETEDHPDIFLCRGLRQPWPEFWKKLRHFG
ncbi:MAG TPA: glycosyltransferase family 39 protein, partial [Terriglobia bacterium]|nr:glycosyltransferase family 39 protein [Terriglobia bacterium]